MTLTIITVVVIVLFLAAWHWSRYTTELANKVLLSPTPNNQMVDLSETKELPPAVKKYFNNVLKDGQPMISRATLIQRGGFRAKPEMKKWSQMKA